MKKLDPAVQAHLEEMHRSYCDYNQKPPADRNGAGTVFASHLHRVVVLRWGNHENLKNIVGLAKKALAEMTAFGAEILIYDMRRLADKEMNALDLACRTLCVSATTVPPIEADKDISRHVLAYQKFLIPLTTTSLVKIFMHVRAGDNLWGSEAPQPKNVLESRGIERHEVSSMVEARTLIERFFGEPLRRLEIPVSALDLPVAVSLVSNNRSGSVFTNLAAGLALIRWTSHANLSYCVDLEATAFQDMAMANSDTLLYELQDLPWECSGVVTQALIHDALLENLVQTLVCVGKLAELNHQPAAEELHALAKAQGKNALFADSFSEATTWINAQRTGQRPLQPANPPLNFKSGYAGSVYSLPQYSTTVICLSGVMDDYRAIMKLLRHAFSLHRHTKARTCVIDTSSCPPLAADTQYTFVYREAVQPLTSGNFDMIIHIRVPGDALWAHGEGMTISQLVTSLGVPYFEVGNMQECLSLLNAIQGKEPRVRPSTLPGEGDLPFPPPDQPFKH